MHPREIAHFSNPRFGAVRIAAGGQCSLAVNEVGSLMFWGQFKVQLVPVVYQFYMCDVVAICLLHFHRYSRPHLLCSLLVKPRCIPSPSTSCRAGSLTGLTLGAYNIFVRKLHSFFLSIFLSIFLSFFLSFLISLTLSLYCPFSRLTELVTSILRLFPIIKLLSGEPRPLVANW